MASSDFWRDIAEQFRDIPEAFTVTAEWSDFSNNGTGKWFLTGSNAAAFSFKAIATRAGSEVTDTRTADLFVTWLNELRRQNFGFKQMAFTVTHNPEGFETGKRCHAGHVPNVCEVSANFCKKLEADAVQAEFNDGKPTPDVFSETITVSQSEAIKETDAKRVKKLDLGRYLDGAKLTDKQYKCASLRWEYGLSVSAIARELNLSRMTIDQHIKSAQKKFDASGMYEKMRKQLARNAQR